MGNLAASAVTRLDTWIDGTSRRRKIVEATLVLGGQGGATNTIPASLFGMSKIQRCSPAIASDNALIYPASPSYDGTLLFLMVAPASSGAPGDVTATVHITVEGIE